jgi:hypothetical protein
MRKLIAAGLAAGLVAVIMAMPASAASEFTVLAITQHGHQHGNVFSFRDRLVQPGDRDDVLGHDEGRCAVKKLGQQRPSTAKCRVVFYLPAGKIKVLGLIDFRQTRNKVPVIGGTRGYNGASGKAIVRNASGKTARITFVLA